MKFSMDEEIKKSGRLFFSNELLVSRIAVAWALGCIVLFGFFGSGNLIINLTKKINLYKEMRQLNYDLNVKLYELNSAYEDLRVVTKYSKALNEIVPTNLNTHDYMVSFTRAVGDSGYSVKNFLPSTESMDGEVPITVILVGFGDVSQLISNIEALPRVTVVDSVLYESSFDASEVRLSIRIFNM